MSIQCYESADSPDLTRKASKGSTAVYRIIALVDNNEGASAASSAAMQLAPPLVATQETFLIRTEASVKVLKPLDRSGNGAYMVEVNYQEDDESDSRERAEPGVWHHSFDTTGGTHKIYQSLEERDYGGPEGGSEPALNGAKVIGWDGEEAHGVDIVVPQFLFDVTAFYNAAQVTTEFEANLARATGKTNSDAWHGFEAGELLFMGASGQGDVPTVKGQRVKPIPVTLKFSASENRTNIDLGEGVTVPAAKGWEYLDVWYHKKKEEGGSNKIVPSIKRWAVHRVYEEIDFASSFGF